MPSTPPRRSLDPTGPGIGAARAAALRGKHYGLLCADPQGADARIVERAAGLLGARVACLRVALAPDSTGEDVQHTAHILGRLYDAVVCIGLDAALVARIDEHAGVPVLACPAGPAPRLAGSGADAKAAVEVEEAHCQSVQTLLLQALVC
ncbi:MAG: ornithine carbamoyltransferase [Burkholderiaceae bacterium]